MIFDDPDPAVPPIYMPLPLLWALPLSAPPAFSILWLYDFPNWLFCVNVIAAFVGFALTGRVIVRRFLPRWFGDKHYNDFVGQSPSAAGVFLGITFGLLSVDAGENYSSVDAAVTGEANAIGVLCRVVDNYSEPHRTILTGQLPD
jgi:hypothetical protein